MGQYDKTMKLLVDSNPEAIARFVLREWQKQEGSVLPNINDIAVTQLSGEFQSEELDGDNVLLIEGPEGPLYLVEIEFQSTLHPYMPLRSLEYITRAKKKHWKRCGHLPVISAIIYLFDDKQIPDSPLHWAAPSGQTAMVFHYSSIKMKELPREELLALNEPELWPLVLLTEGTVDRIIVGDMFAELLEQKLYNILPLGHTIAAWFLQGDDLSWLNKEYQKMFEFFHESPALQWMEESVTERVTKRVTERVTEQVRQQERQKAQQERQKVQQEIRELLAEQKKNQQLVLAEQKKNQQLVLAEQKKNQQLMLAEQKKNVALNRQTVMEIVSQRFPSHQRLAKAQVQTLKQPELFQKLILRLSLARDADEAQEILLSLHENEEMEDAQDTSAE